MVEKVQGKQSATEAEQSTASVEKYQESVNAKFKKIDIYTYDANGNGVIDQPELEKAMDDFKSNAARFTPNAKIEAFSKGYKATANPNFYYDDQNKKHYMIDKDGNLLEAKDVSWVGKDGSYAKRTKGKNGTQKYVGYDKNSYPKEMKAFDASGKNPVENAKDSAAGLGLRTTLATDSQGVYYDESTKIHYQWNDKTHSFKAMKDVDMIAADGRTFDKNGKNEYGSRLRKDGQVVNNEGFIYKREVNGDKVIVTETLAPGETNDITFRKTELETLHHEPMVTKEEVVYSNGDKKVSTRDKNTLRFTHVTTGYVVTTDANHNTIKTPYKLIEKEGVAGSYMSTHINSKGEKITLYYELNPNEVKSDGSWGHKAVTKEEYDAIQNRTTHIYKAAGL